MSSSTLPPPEADVQYFARREKIYPRSAHGRYRRLKWLVMTLTLGLYYLAPFIRWDRGLDAPDQAILIDLNQARAYWFFIEIWPQEVYYLTAILIFAAIALFFVTALLGRVWCGYFCPQTVWTDLFIKVEQVIQGDRGARKRLDESPLSFEKIWKKGLTHLVWLLIGLCTGGAFVFYFNDAPTLWHQILAFDVSPMVLAFIGGLTFSTYLMAGFAREQVCFYMCPYARFQSAMFDRDTLIIAYDEKRGEPRGIHKKGAAWEGRGHCIDCSACVQVCPVGIDIRKGLQMECIACGLCVDACNDIMAKIDLPKGLIRYDSESNMEKGGTAAMLKRHIFRPRSFLYLFVLLAVASIVLFKLITRDTLELNVLHDRNPLVVQLSDGRVRNGYHLKILNKSRVDQTLTLTVAGVPNAELQAQMGGASDQLWAPADAVVDYHVFIKAPFEPSPAAKVIFTVTDPAGVTMHETASQFIYDQRMK